MGNGNTTFRGSLTHKHLLRSLRKFLFPRLMSISKEILFMCLSLLLDQYLTGKKMFIPYLKKTFKGFPLVIAGIKSFKIILQFFML